MSIAFLIPLICPDCSPAASIVCRMNTSPFRERVEIRRLTGVLVVAQLVMVPSFAIAQTLATGVIEGRVINARTSQYIENARIVVEGTALEAFTDAGGQYTMYNVPAGAVTVRASFTSLDSRIETLTLTAGTTVRRDFELGGTAEPGTVRLAKFVVSSSREMDGAAIAINEQRYAANIKTVIAADEFGSVVENDIGEILKFVPGVTMDYNGGDARRISMDGVSSDYVPVTVAGFGLANANQSGMNRAASLDQVSLNNISRIEINQTPTPESPGGALAGSVCRAAPLSARSRCSISAPFSPCGIISARSKKCPVRGRIRRFARCRASIFPTSCPSTTASASASPAVRQRPSARGIS